MKKLWLLLLILPALHTSCSTYRTVKYMESGSVSPEAFVVKIPFEYRLGLVILKVTLQGKEYDFLLDSGAPNSISKALADKLGFTKDFDRKVGDSQGSSGQLGFTMIDKMSLGGVEFSDQGAVIIDMKSQELLSCLHVDGLVGANLMRTVVWKIDYQHQEITLSNSLAALKLPPPAHKIPFTTSVTGSPYVQLDLNGVTVDRVLLDLGSSSGFKLSYDVLDNLEKDDPKIAKTYGYGSQSFGLYGLGKKDTTFFIKAADCKIGEQPIAENIIRFPSATKRSIGTQFFKQYDLVFDWFKKEVMFFSRNLEKATLSNFGFYCLKQDNRLVVSFVYENANQVKIGDVILRIGTENLENFTVDKWCEKLENGYFDQDAKEISITIERDGVTQDLTLKRMDLL
ncbi:MAG: aspartyl protease family protein [Salibacteraceae bacterium]